MRLLPLLAALAAFWITTPAGAQYLYMDSSGDGVCDYPFEPLVSNTSTSVDIWIDTAANLDGSPAACSTGEPLSMTGYEIVLQAAGNGSQTAFHSWSNAIAAFTANLGSVQSDGLFRVAFYSGSTYLAPGKHKLGTVTLTYAGDCPNLGFRAEAVILGTTYGTNFSSECPTLDSDYTARLGEDFFDTCFAGPICSSVEDLDTTWGKIKSQYK